MDDYLEKKMVGEKMARISVAKAKEMLDEKAQEKEQTSRNVGIEVRGKNALLKLGWLPLYQGINVKLAYKTILHLYIRLKYVYF